MTERWAVFISGRGSNLSAILSSLAIVKHPVKLVVTSKQNCEGVYKARRAGVPVFYMEKENWAGLELALKKHQINKIFLAGFMRILPSEFVDRWQGRVVNVHPSLLPSYPGLKSIQRAFEDGADVGITVHEVIADVDSGKNLLQRKVVRGNPASQELREVEFLLHTQEHRLVRRVAEKWRSVSA